MQRALRALQKIPFQDQVILANLILDEEKERKKAIGLTKEKKDGTAVHHNSDK